MLPPSPLIRFSLSPNEVETTGAGVAVAAAVGLGLAAPADLMPSAPGSRCAEGQREGAERFAARELEVSALRVPHAERFLSGPLQLKLELVIRGGGNRN